MTSSARHYRYGRDVETLSSEEDQEIFFCVFDPNNPETRNAAWRIEHNPQPNHECLNMPIPTNWAVCQDCLDQFQNKEWFRYYREELTENGKEDVVWIAMKASCPTMCAFDRDNPETKDAEWMIEYRPRPHYECTATEGSNWKLCDDCREHFTRLSWVRKNGSERNGYFYMDKMLA